MWRGIGWCAEYVNFNVTYRLHRVPCKDAPMSWWQVNDVAFIIMTFPIRVYNALMVLQPRHPFLLQPRHPFLFLPRYNQDTHSYSKEDRRFYNQDTHSYSKEDRLCRTQPDKLHDLSIRPLTHQTIPKYSIMSNLQPRHPFLF